MQSSWNLWILLPVIFARYFCQKYVYIIRWSGGEFKVITVWRSLGRLSPNVHVMSDFYNLSQYFKTSWCKSLSLKAFRDGGFCLRAMQGDSAIPFAEPCVPLQKAELAEPLEQLEQMSASSAPWMEPADPAGARAALWLDNLKLWVKQHHRQWGCNHLSHWLPHQNPNKGIVYDFGFVFERRILHVMLFTSLLLFSHLTENSLG